MSHKKITDIIGKRFGKLVPIKWIKLDNRSNSMFLCVCDCNNKIEVTGADLRRGHTKSCGCLRVELAKIRATKHGLSNSPEYIAWRGMQNRCLLNPSYKYYADYGGRGIKVSSIWLGPGGFERFLAEVGKRPSDKHSLDRIENNKNYEPGNVKWSTPAEQIANRRKSSVLENFTNEELIAEMIHRGLHV